MLIVLERDRWHTEIADPTATPQQVRSLVRSTEIAIDRGKCALH